MSCILLTEPSIAGLKTQLREEYAEIPEVKSSHLSEALARALGFNTHAALLAAVRNPNRTLAPGDDYRHLNYDAFRLRLQELSSIRDDEGLDQFELGHYPGVISNDPNNDIVYRSERDRSWRNVMVAGINAGLEAGLFTIRPNDNRWFGAGNRNSPSGAHVVFDVAPSLPALAWFSDAGFGELSVGVAVNPSADTIRLRGGGDGFHWGDAVARGWLERQRGAWLQSSTTLFACRRALRAKLAALDVRPRCFGDRGRLIM